jgi:L-ascorbate metabolism protein UlaG (beta-lactamase superfamily)
MTSVARRHSGEPARSNHGDAARERTERMRRSPQYRAGKFHNPVPASQASPNLRGVVADWRASRGAARRPAHPIPIVTATPEPALDGLHVTWLGHATSLVEIEGRRLLLDPVWSQRCSPSHLAGPKRLHPMPYGLEKVANVDAIVISHDHYDHLDLPTVRSLTRLSDAPFVAPLGVGAHLHGWGVPEERIVELDWNESTIIHDVRLVATPARHFSGRGLSRDGTLWSSWVIAGPTRRLFYSGDTGYFDRFASIGAEHGPFDVTLIQVGAYSEGWPDIHVTPEQGVRAHLDVRGGLLIPVHWATWVLAMHPWAAPVERVLAEAEQHDVRVAVPRPGQRVDVDNPPEVDGWWRAIS